MIVSIASGKGGTGKTTVATGLALHVGRNVTYADADVEAPNGHLFLHPTIERTFAHNVPTVRVDHDICTFCGKCAEVCRFHAIAVIPKSVLVFDELCHGCGGCLLTCPEKAISEVKRPTGVIKIGATNGVRFVGGCLNVGEAMSPPLIHAVRDAVANDETVILDAPPGTSCPVVAAVYQSDFCVLVTEPTPFGLHDFSLAVKMIRQLGVPFGAVINRVGIGDDRVHAFCEKEGIEILAEIPDDRRVAEAYARGEVPSQTVPEVAAAMADLWDAVTARLASPKGAHQ